MAFSIRSGRKIAVAALAALACSMGAVTAPALAASSPTPARPSPGAGHGMDGETLQHDLDLVTQAGAIAVVGAARGSHQWWQGASGVRSIDAARTARPGDTFRVGSITKTMIATLAMQQVQARRWKLTTRVGDVLPGLLPGHELVTLEQLLSHRSGLPDYFGTLLAGAQTPDQLLTVLHRPYTDAQLVAVALKQPWLFRPGTDYSYSNTEYVVVGMMLEQATQRSVAHLLRNRIFVPAGMRSSTYPTRLPGFRWTHLSEYALFERPYNFDATNPSVFSSAGAVVSTAPDLDRFYRALFTGQLLPMNLVRNMATPRTVKAGDPAYGLGIYLVGDPCPGPKGQQQYLYGHDGATFGTLSTAFTSPDGKRQASVNFTGRDYLTAAPPTAKLANDFLIDAFSQTCPRPVSATAKKKAAGQLAQALRGSAATTPAPALRR